MKGAAGVQKPILKNQLPASGLKGAGKGAASAAPTKGSGKGSWGGKNNSWGGDGQEEMLTKALQYFMQSGGGDNWGGNSWGKRENKGNVQPRTTVDATFKVNPNMKYVGTVDAYWRLKGYGFIVLDKKGVVPDDKIFCHWADIKSSDRFPSLDQQARVQFTLNKREKNGSLTIVAQNITNENGQPIDTQEGRDEKKTFVGGKDLRYTGTMKFFSPKKQFGYIAVDDGYDYGGEEVPKEIRVELSEINSENGRATRMEDTPVEFGIWKTLKNAYKAYNVTAPGGAYLPGYEETKQ